ncbi:MAG: ABC transporter permease [Chloroflexi bacterium]|nr:ABC transporter permease [Chloroflexota bacterium]
MAARRRGFRFQFVPMVPGAIILLLLFTAIFANLLAPFSPVGTTLADSMTPPSWVEGGTTKYLLGTDLFGRDQISRLIFGARVSLSVSLTVIILGIGLGTTIGMISGFFAGKLDSFFMRVVDMNLSFPAILIAIVMAVVFGPSFRNVILIIVFVQWARVARIMRGESLALRTQDFVTLARVAGASNRRIIMRHILPNVFPTMLVLATLEVGSVILFEASLSFLGVGIPPPQPSWGVMVADGRGQIATGWWISLFPGACIFFTCLSMNSVGDWLRDRLDPRLRTL